jgi:hypothetical protein
MAIDVPSTGSDDVPSNPRDYVMALIDQDVRDSGLVCYGLR